MRRSGRRLPPRLEDWSPQDVGWWLETEMNIPAECAERFSSQDVSGICLVEYQKNDLREMGISHGPAVRIVAEIARRRSKPAAEGPETEADPRPEPRGGPVEDGGDAQDEEAAPGSWKMQKKQKKKGKVFPSGRKDKTKAPAAASLPIKDALDDLSERGLKDFIFTLREFSKKQGPIIPKGKLEGRDPVDMAEILTNHYGDQRALEVTRDVLVKINQRPQADKLQDFLDGSPPQQQPGQSVLKEASQGDKLKNLLTCGGNTLDGYDKFVVVVNRSREGQVEHLDFLSKLKLLCVLDFDPNSNCPGGLCESFNKSRVANLHVPPQYQGRIDHVINNLNLHTDQTSWVFCNGRRDLGRDSDEELDFKTWWRKSSRDVEQVVSVICHPEVLLHGRKLIVFLLLSPVETEKDPMFEIFKSFLRHTEEEQIVHICESRSTFAKWSDLIREKCECDIQPRSLYELNLSQVNGTVAELGGFKSSERLLPSSDFTTVVLKQRDENLMTALDVLCVNQCQNRPEEDSQDFRGFRIKVEEEFYRGGRVKWWNFYFCEKYDKEPFVKRDKYEKVRSLIRAQQHDHNDACVLLNFFHHPGCGGSTLAMHVMWDLRCEFRCAVLKESKLPKEEIAAQVVKLMTLETNKAMPVLLLLDITKESKNPDDLLSCIRRASEDFCSVDENNAGSCKVIILNCVRSHCPREQYLRQNAMRSQFMTASLTPAEQQGFEKKLKDLQESHAMPENFYAFMIMKNNFDPKYIDDLACYVLEKFDRSGKDGKLISFLALLNTYVADSQFALSLCEDFFGIKIINWGTASVMTEMKTYSNILIVERVENWGGYKGLRILHRTIAAACLEELERSHFLKDSEITTELLHYDLFFSDGVVKNQLMLSIERMLILRQRKQDSDERETFSPFIDKIHNRQGQQVVQDIFEKASSRFLSSASIPQALARYLYIHVRDFPKALKWAEKAKAIKENPYTVDTIGQVYKSHLRSNMDREKQQQLSPSPEGLDANLKLANDGMTAFRRAQEQSEMEEPRGDKDDKDKDDDDDDSGDFPKKTYNVYGYVRMLDIAFLVFEILGRLPFFEERDPIKKQYLRNFLKKKMPVASVHKDESDENAGYDEVIGKHQAFLHALRTKVKETFDFLDCYFTYIKGNSEFDIMNHKTVCTYYKKYVDLFCTTQETIKKAKESNPNLNLSMDIDERWEYLERNQADTFSGILQHLDKSAEEMEKVIACYAFLLQKNKYNVRIKIFYILSNVVLHNLNPKSRQVKDYRYLSPLMSETLQEVGHSHRFPDPYYLAVLWFWPPCEGDAQILTYVKAIQTSSHRHMSKLFYKRSTIAHLYLGKEEGLKRLVSKPNLDKYFLPKMPRDKLAELWKNGDIFKEPAICSRLLRVPGMVDQGKVFAIYERLKIEVRPARIWIRSGFSMEKISFFLGFAVNGPLAYDIKYESA